MSYEHIRDELNHYYFTKLPDIAESIRQNVYNSMDDYAKRNPDMNAYNLKAKLYETITNAIKPVIFPDIPFFFETGALVAFSDGRYNRGAQHANGWLYNRNHHLFCDIDPYGYDMYRKHSHLYLQCGTYADMMHQGLPLKKIFKIGLKGILSELREAERTCKTKQEKDFIACATVGINSLCKMAEKFADAAKKAGNLCLARIAEQVPFNPPETMHEGLCVMAFVKKGFGSLEGMGFSSFGRADVLLAPLYENDIKKGIPYQELLDLVTKFLLVWDCTLNLSKKFEYGAEYELENTLTLGGCDKDGKPVFNEVTKLFLKARDNETILYPKMMLRYSEKSPQEYLELITAPLLKSRSFSLYENDDAIIPALIQSGIDEEDAYDYAVGGCWDILIPDKYIHNSGEYVNILKPLVWSIFRQQDMTELSGFYFEPLDEVESFEELYYRYLGFIRRILVQKAALSALGSKEWHKVNPACILSALMEPCIPAKLDVTNGGGKYNREVNYFSGFAETVDSLMAIKHLCFDKKAYTLKELFEQCKLNWEDALMQRQAFLAPKFGDGSEESSKFVGKFVDDLYRISHDLPTAQPGEYRIGSNLYTEIVRWAKYTPATPNGRKDGEYLAQGLSPSRYQKQISATEMLSGYRYIDMNKMAANASVSLTLPATQMDKSRIVAFMRGVAKSGIQALQPNCVNIDELRAAQKEPEKYGHIIVRICGFSAPFVALAPHYQEEFISRMMLEA